MRDDRSFSAETIVTYNSLNETKTTTAGTTNKKKEKNLKMKRPKYDKDKRATENH